MRLIIDIPEKVVTAIQNGEDYRYDIHTTIAQGIPYEERPQGEIKKYKPLELDYNVQCAVENLRAAYWSHEPKKVAKDFTEAEDIIISAICHHGYSVCKQPQCNLADEVWELYEKHHSHLATHVIEFGDELKELLCKYQKGGTDMRKEAST